MALNNRAVEWQLKNLKPLKTTKLRAEMTQWAHKSQTIYSIKSLFVLVGIFFVASFILCCQCLSCLIIKCMLLTFIFNYFPSRLCDVATSPSSASLSCPAQSSISHSFSVYQVDIFMLQTQNQHTHTRAHKSPTRGEGNIKKILFLAKHEESAERAESHDRRRFLQKIWPQNVSLCECRASPSCFPL